MNATKFAALSFLAILFFNALLIAVLSFVTGNLFAGEWVAVLLTTAVLTLLLWFVVYTLGKRLRPTATTTPAPTAPATPPAAAPASPSRPALPPEASALQLLSILQRKGRLIDFLQEDLGQYDDAQIGAAVRTVHEGCKQALREHVQLEPIYAEAEGSTVTVSPGFDAHAVRLVGHVSGEPPFRGALLHRGWRVARIDLPERLYGKDEAAIVAAAEVEVGS